VRSGGESSADGIGRHFGHAGGEDTVTHYILTRASSAVSICAFVLVKQVKGVPGVHRRLSVRLPHPAARAPLCASTALHHTSAYVSIRQHTSAYARIRQHTSAYVRLPHPAARAALCARTATYAGVCWRMLAYANVCRRMLTHADVFRRMKTYADLRRRILTYVTAALVHTNY
jgi:hypothetical protein